MGWFLSIGLLAPWQAALLSGATGWLTRWTQTIECGEPVRSGERPGRGFVDVPPRRVCRLPGVCGVMGVYREKR